MKKKIAVIVVAIVLCVAAAVFAVNQFLCV